MALKDHHVLVFSRLQSPIWLSISSGDKPRFQIGLEGYKKAISWRRFSAPFFCSEKKNEFDVEIWWFWHCWLGDAWQSHQSRLTPQSNNLHGARVKNGNRISRMRVEKIFLKRTYTLGQNSIFYQNSETLRFRAETLKHWEIYWDAKILRFWDTEKANLRLLDRSIETLHFWTKSDGLTQCGPLSFLPAINCISFLLCSPQDKCGQSDTGFVWPESDGKSSLRAIVA